MSTGDNELPAGPDPKANAILDCEQIDGLVAAAGIAGTLEILDAFWRSSDNLIRALQEQLQRGDLVEASRTAHALKGSSLNVGAMRLSCAARSIEDACRTRDANGALKRLENVETQYAETVEAFNAHLAA
jgi:HPt (histidine-containing phosphotransfer) domain-containing protein